jgi:hypothetical protein
MFDPGSEAMKILTDICQTKVVWIPAAVSSGFSSVLQLILAADLVVALCKFNTDGKDISEIYNNSGSSIIHEDSSTDQTITIGNLGGEDDNSLL